MHLLSNNTLVTGEIRQRHAFAFATTIITSAAIATAGAVSKDAAVAGYRPRTADKAGT